MSAEDRLLSVKARIGAACQGVLEDPEGRWTELEEVTKLAEDRDPEVARLGALSAALVFKDVCPGYRIRALTPKELAMKVTKETQKLRDFEAGLLRMYKGFVRLVVRRGGGEKKTRAQRGGGLGLAPGVALTCLCQLLAALPHFNFRTDVLSALVPHMARADAAAAGVVAGAVAGAIKSDKSGELTLEALQMTAQLVRQTKCGAHPKALAPFLEIAFDEGALALEAKKKAEVLSRKQTKKRRAEEREAIRKGRAEKAKKKADKERLARFGHVDDASDASEDELNEETKLDRDMEEGAGRIDNQKRRKLQSKMLEATFEMYFRVLKNAAGESPARGLPLMTPALVGLGKFTHLISVSFMADLMEVFRRLLKGDTLSADQKARCLLTACEITSGHGEALQVDAGEFHRQLYAMLGEPSIGTSGWGDRSAPKRRTRTTRRTTTSTRCSPTRARRVGRRSGPRDPSRARSAEVPRRAEAGGPEPRRRLCQTARLRGARRRGRRGGGRAGRGAAAPRGVPARAVFAGERARRHEASSTSVGRPGDRQRALRRALGPRAPAHPPPRRCAPPPRWHACRWRARWRRRWAATRPASSRGCTSDARELQAGHTAAAGAQESKLSPLDRAAARGASRAVVAEIGEDLAAFGGVLRGSRIINENVRTTGRKLFRRQKEAKEDLERRALKRPLHAGVSVRRARRVTARGGARARLARRARAFAEERAAAAKKKAAKKKARSTLSSPETGRALKKKKAKK